MLSKKAPIISVITACYNAEKTIMACIDSVRDQDYCGYEHIIIDGYSNDRTREILKQGTSSTTTVVSEKDDGVYDAMNKGLALSTGKYIAFLNADDLYIDSSVLKRVAQLADSSGADCIMGDVLFFENESNGVKKNRFGRHYRSANFKWWWVQLGIMPPHPALFIKTELLRELGGFDVSFKIAADFDLFARIMIHKTPSVAFTKNTLTLFRIGGLSTASMGARQMISSEMSASLASLGFRGLWFKLLLRYPMKLLQYLPSREKRIAIQKANLVLAKPCDMGVFSQSKS
jgi:glycosyltransferase involved in cell wall biosynthesis